MHLQRLLDDIEAARWFTNLGAAVANDFVVPVNDLSSWRQFLSSQIAAEFGLTYDGVVGYPYSEMSWLPTSNDEPDPIHGSVLPAAARDAGVESGFVAARIAAFKAATRSQRSCGELPPLRDGCSDLTGAALSGGRYACRMAGAEAFLGRDGFWCNLVQIYCNGNWPMARLPDGRVVVL